MKTNLTLAGISALFLSLSLPAIAQQAPADQVGALKTSLATSHAALQQYEWTETTAVSLKGEEKFRKLARCSYAADGGVIKVPLDVAPPPEEKHGLPGKVAADQQEELTAYMQQAVALVKCYVPPQPAQIQAAKEAGKMSMDIVEPNKRVRLSFRDYYKSNDTLGLDLDIASNRLLGMSVQTYLPESNDAVSLVVQMATLPDGTVYTAGITLEAPAEKISVVVNNSDYRRKGN